VLHAVRESQVSESRKETEELLQKAAEVISGRQDRADLAAHGLTLGEPIVGDDAKKLFLDQLDREEREQRELLDHLTAADALWNTLGAGGVKEGSIRRFEATFQAAGRAAAGSLAAEFNGKEWAREGWSAQVKAKPSGELQVLVVTRPLVLGPEPLQALATLLLGAGHDHSCTFAGMKLAPARPWWRFW
jgi:hypothetical protein